MVGWEAGCTLHMSPGSALLAMGAGDCMGGHNGGGGKGGLGAGRGSNHLTWPPVSS